MRVLKYWCEPADDESKAILLKQISLGRDYARELDEHENQRRDAFRSYLRKDTDYSALDDEIDELYETTPKERRDKVFKAKVEGLKKKRTAAYKAARSQSWFDTAVQQDVLTRNAANKLTRKRIGPSGLGLGFGSYQHEEDAHRQSASTRAPYLPLVRHRVPKEGCYAVHLQAGYKAPITDVMTGKCAWVKIDPEPYAVSRPVKYGARVKDPSKLSGRRLYEVTLRVGAKSVIRVHAKLHRIPLSGTLVWAKVHTTRVGRKLRYSLQLTVDNPTYAKVVATVDHTMGTVGIDLGWREVDDGFLVGTAVDDMGNQLPPLIVPKEVATRAIPHKGNRSRSATLRSTRDDNLNALIKQLTAARKDVTLPEWFRSDTEHTGKWKSPGRVVALLIKWRDARWDGDEVLYALVEAFVKQDGHLWDWEAHNRTRMARQIRGLYQRWADALAKVYSKVLVEDLSLSKAAEDFRKYQEAAHNKDPNKSKQTLLDKRAHLQLAHIGYSLKRACDRTGSSLGLVDKAYTSRTCASCGVRGPKDANKLVSCSNNECDVYEVPVDRDTRAATNIASSEVTCWLAGSLAPPKVNKPRARPRKRVAPAAASAAAA